MDARSIQDVGDVSAPSPKAGRLIYRQSIWTRLTHWLWAISLFFLMLTGLQIFNAHPNLYIGDQSGFQFDNSILRIGAENTPSGPRGYTTILGAKFDTTGVLGLSGEPQRPRAFPSWATIPSYYDLGTSRVIHFFFAWILVVTLLVWLTASLLNGHAWRDRRAEIARLAQPARRFCRPSEIQNSITRASTMCCRNCPMPAFCSCSCR